MKPFYYSVFLMLVSFSAGQSQTEAPSPFTEIVDWSSQPIETAREELKAARAQIAREQLPQLEKLARIQSALTRLRNENRQLTIESEALKQLIEKRSDRIQKLTSQQQSAQFRFLRIRQILEENLHPVERAKYKAKFLGLEQAGAGNSVDQLERLKALFAIANATIDRIDQQVGGHRFRANALTGGVMTAGKVAQVGPYAFFLSDQGEAGLLVVDDALQPRVRSHASSTAANIASAVEGRETMLPFDPLLDQAFLNADARVTLWGHLKSGGVWIIPIVFFGVLSAVIAALKIIQIRKIKVPETGLINALVNTSDSVDIEKRLEEISPTTRPVFAEGIAYRDAPAGARSAAMRQVLLGFREQVESKLSLIALTAAVAPLLGLLGTVTGMIKTFQIISLHGAGDARALSGGISEALVTTELGLVVAIPALLAHAWLNRRSKRIIIQTAALAERFDKTLPEADSRK